MLICTSSLPLRSLPLSLAPNSRDEGGVGRQVGQHTPSCRHCRIRRIVRRDAHERPDRNRQLPPSGLGYLTK